MALALVVAGQEGGCDTLVAPDLASARLVGNTEPARLGVRYACGVSMRSHTQCMGRMGARRLDYQSAVASSIIP